MKPAVRRCDMRHAACGMTLVELLIVLGIIGLIVGMSVPALTRYTQQVRLKSSVRQVMGLVSLARSVAIGSHQDHALIVDAEHQELHITNLSTGETLEQVVRLPTSVTVTVQVNGAPAAEPKIVFRATGSLLGRTTSLVLADQHKQQTITVTGATGAMSLQ